MDLKQIKYELGPTYNHAREFEVGLRIWYFTSGRAKARITWFRDVAHSDAPIVETFNKYLTADVGKTHVVALTARLMEAQFFLLRAASRSSGGDGRYQRLKVYRPMHEVNTQNIAFPRDIEGIIKDLRKPFEEYLGGYNDPNRRFRIQGEVLQPYVKAEPVLEARDDESTSR